MDQQLIRPQKSTVGLVAALVILENVRIYAQFAQYVDSSVCKIRTWYDRCSLLNKNRFKGMKIVSNSNKTLIELFYISQRDVTNSITNDKFREQVLSNNAVRRSCKYVYF